MADAGDVDADAEEEGDEPVQSSWFTAGADMVSVVRKLQQSGSAASSRRREADDARPPPAPDPAHISALSVEDAEAAPTLQDGAFGSVDSYFASGGASMVSVLQKLRSSGGSGGGGDGGAAAAAGERPATSAGVRPGTSHVRARGDGMTTWVDEESELLTTAEEERAARVLQKQLLRWLDAARRSAGRAPLPPERYKSQSRGLFYKGASTLALQGGAAGRPPSRIHRVRSEQLSKPGTTLTTFDEERSTQGTGGAAATALPAGSTPGGGGVQGAGDEANVLTL